LMWLKTVWKRSGKYTPSNKEDAISTAVRVSLETDPVNICSTDIQIRYV
jgi:hypothetical protein